MKILLLSFYFCVSLNLWAQGQGPTDIQVDQLLSQIKTDLGKKAPVLFAYEPFLTPADFNLAIGEIFAHRPRNAAERKIFSEKVFSLQLFLTSLSSYPRFTNETKGLEVSVAINVETILAEMMKSPMLYATVNARKDKNSGIGITLEELQSIKITNVKLNNENAHLTFSNGATIALEKSANNHGLYNQLNRRFREGSSLLLTGSKTAVYDVLNIEYDISKSSEALVKINIDSTKLKSEYHTLVFNNLKQYYENIYQDLFADTDAESLNQIENFHRNAKLLTTDFPRSSVDLTWLIAETIHNFVETNYKQHSSNEKIIISLFFAEEIFKVDPSFYLPKEQLENMNKLTKKLQELFFGHDSNRVLMEYSFKEISAKVFEGFFDSFSNDFKAKYRDQHRNKFEEPNRPILREKFIVPRIGL